MFSPPYYNVSFFCFFVFRFQRPQRRDLPIGLGGSDPDYSSPACEKFNTDEVMAGDRRAIVFKSPNYPNNYPNNTDCVRRLTGE